MTGRLAALFATLAILITGLGLFGLAALYREQRTKEIGIRKLWVPPSADRHHMSQDFSQLVLIVTCHCHSLAW